MGLVDTLVVIGDVLGELHIGDYRKRRCEWQDIGARTLCFSSSPASAVMLFLLASVSAGAVCLDGKSALWAWTGGEDSSTRQMGDHVLGSQWSQFARHLGHRSTVLLWDGTAPAGAVPPSRSSLPGRPVAPSLPSPPPTQQSFKRPIIIRRFINSVQLPHHTVRRGPRKAHGTENKFRLSGHRSGASRHPGLRTGMSSGVRLGSSGASTFSHHYHSTPFP